MRLQVLGSLLAGIALFAAPAAAEVRITIADGNVTLSARDATLRQILAEWARVGQTRIVNLERLSGAPLSLELTNVPEAQALDTVLRSVSGYLAAPRAVVAPNASRYDRIFLLPSSSGASAPVRATTATPPAPPVFAPPAFAQPEEQPAGELARPVPNPAQPNVPSRGPVFGTFPQAEPPQSRQRAVQPGGPASSPAPTAPVGVSRPGMVVPAPPQPGQAPRPDDQP